MKKIISVILCMLFAVMLFSCTPLPSEDESSKASSDETEAPELTAEGESFSEAKTDETVTSDDGTEITVLGEGETKIFVDVVTADSTLHFEILTDSKILGDALTQTGLVEGEEGPYGLYIKKVNGISAVYETDGAYWSLNVDGEAAATGADGIDIYGGERIELIYTLA